jgi:hypothetical protein
MKLLTENLIRHPDWRKALGQYVFERMHTPFTWGHQDCCLFAAGAVEAITGTNPGKHLIGTYKTALGATRKLNKLGGLEGVLSACFQPVPRLHADSGDIVLLTHNGQKLLGVMFATCPLAPGESGLVRLPFDCVESVWRVPCR